MRVLGHAHRCRHVPAPGGRQRTGRAFSLGSCPSPLPAYSRRAPHRPPPPDHSHSNTPSPHLPTQPCGVAASTEGFGPADPGSSPGRAIQLANQPPTVLPAGAYMSVRAGAARSYAPALAPAATVPEGDPPARSRRDSRQGRPFAAWDHGGMRGGHVGADRGRRRPVHT